MDRKREGARELDSELEGERGTVQVWCLSSLPDRAAIRTEIAGLITANVLIRKDDLNLFISD